MAIPCPSISRYKDAAILSALEMKIDDSPGACLLVFVRSERGGRIDPTPRQMWTLAI
jgi:hypothetical protein